MRIAFPSQYPIFRALLFILILSPLSVYAYCVQKIATAAPPISYDVTSLLNLSSPLSLSGITNYPGTFYCSLSALEVLAAVQNSVSNSSPYLSKTVYLKYPGETYVSLSVTSLSPSNVRITSSGNINGSVANANYTLQLRLLRTNPGKNVIIADGDTASINPLIIARDSSRPGVIYARDAALSDTASPKGFTFSQEIYHQPLRITFIRHATTCSFADDNKTVVLNNIDLSSLSRGVVNGKTAFTLNFHCQDLVNGTANRNISAYLSSQTLLASDNTTLIPSSPDSAAGVGIRVAKASDNVPLRFSASTTVQGSATSLFTSAPGQPFSPTFSLPMNAWYYVYNKQKITSGPVRTTAVVNFVYD